MAYAEIPIMKLNNGAAVPMLAFGTGSALMKPADDGKIESELVEQIKTAIKVGYTHLDCAQAYNTELEVGKAIQESGISRDKLFITTKTLGFAPIAQALDASLMKLQVDHVDLYLLHIPWFEAQKPLDEAWKEMEAVKASGKAKAIGVSNFLVSHLEKILPSCIETPAVNQFESSIYLQRKELYDFCQDKGIAVEAFGVLTPCNVAAGGPADALLTSLAKKYAVTEAEICMNWCIARGMVVVTTSLKEQRLRDYLRVETFQLTPQEVEELSEVGAKKHFRKQFTDYFAEDDRS